MIDASHGVAVALAVAAGLGGIAIKFPDIFKSLQGRLLCVLAGFIGLAIAYDLGAQSMWITLKPFLKADTALKASRAMQKVSLGPFLIFGVPLMAAAYVAFLGYLADEVEKRQKQREGDVGDD